MQLIIEEMCTYVAIVNGKVQEEIASLAAQNKTLDDKNLHTKAYIDVFTHDE